MLLELAASVGRAGSAPEARGKENRMMGGTVNLCSAYLGGVCLMNQIPKIKLKTISRC